MSQSSVDNRDSLVGVTERLPDGTADYFRTATGPGRRAVGAHRATPVRSHRLDHRVRTLGTQPANHVPTMSTRMDGQPRRRRGHIPLLAKVAVLVGVAALAALLLQSFVVQPFSVPGNAMTPTFLAGDRILVVKSGVLASPIRSGEIVVFQPRKHLPCMSGSRGGDLVLRVIALPGETIWSVDNTVFVDGRPLSEREWYNPDFGQLGSTPIASTTLGRGQYFVMADNRSDACDSRAFGPISQSSIVGEGIAIVGRDGHVFFRTL